MADQQKAKIKKNTDRRPIGASDIWGSVDFKLKRHHSPHGQVTAVSMMKDEGPFLIEWVAHHIAVGFTDLIVFTNDCSDGTDKMLIRLEQLGLCHHRRNDIPDGLRPQPSALNYAQDDPVVKNSDWVMVFDADEFLSIKYGNGTLDDLLSATKEKGANGVVVTWRIFGSGGIVVWSRAPVTEQYLMAAPPSWNKGWGVKTLFAFDADYWKLGIHRPKIKNRHIKTDFPDSVVWLTGSGNQMEDYFKFRGWRSISRTIGYDWVQLNHYAVKSVESYALRKLRGNVNNKADKYNSDYWSLQDRNEVRDETMLRYKIRRDQIISELLTDPELLCLHLAAVDGAEKRLVQMRQSEVFHHLVSDLSAASKLSITQVVAKPPKARDKEKIATLMSDVEKRRSEAAKELRQTLPKVKQEGTPIANYLDDMIGCSDDISCQWFVNHSLKLPTYSGVFSPNAIQAIKSGKFERSLVRRLPQVIAPGAIVLEIGSAVGFVAGHCVNVRPDVSFIMQENNSILKKMMLTVFRENERIFTQKFVIHNQIILDDQVSKISEIFGNYSANVLLLACAKFANKDILILLDMLSEKPPLQVFLYGRFLEQSYSNISEITKQFLKFGYVEDYGFDLTIARGFRYVEPAADTAKL